MTHSQLQVGLLCSHWKCDKYRKTHSWLLERGWLSCVGVFWSYSKKSRPLPSQLGIGPCQYENEKSVGPVGALTICHSLIQVGSGDAVNPPASTRQVSGRGPGGKAPRSSEDLIFYNTKMIKNSKIVCIFEFLGRIVPSCLIRLQKNLEKWVSILVKVENNSRWVKKYICLRSHGIASIASILKIRLGLDR